MTNTVRIAKSAVRIAKSHTEQFYFLKKLKEIKEIKKETRERALTCKERRGVFRDLGAYSKHTREWLGVL